jgi:hypothetical protein
MQDLPKGGKVVKAQGLGLSDWCDNTRYDVELPDGTIESFFEKVCGAGFSTPAGTVCVTNGLL